MPTIDYTALKRHKTEFLLSIVFFVSFFINFKEVQLLVAFKQIILLLLCLAICSVQFSRSFSISKAFFPSIIIISTFLSYFFVRETYVLTDSLILLTLLSIPLINLELKNSFLLRKVEIVTAGVIILNLIFFRSSGRSTIGNIDPNFSSLLIFIFICYLLKARSSKWLVVTCVLAGFMTLSRTYFLAVGFLFVSLLIKNRKLLFLIFMSLPFILLGALHFFSNGPLDQRFPILYSISENLYYSSGEHTNPLRILHLIGNTSDNIRSAINAKTLDLMQSDASFFMFGYHPEKFELAHGFKMAHNFFLFQLSQSGILLGILALLGVYSIFVRKFEGINAHVLIGLSAYFAFLGLEVGSVYFIFIILVLCCGTKSPSNA